MAIRGNETRPRLTTSLPGPEAKKLVRKDDRYLLRTTKTAPIAISQGKGCIVEDVDGNRLLDFSSGIAVLNTGHSHPKVVKAIADQAARFTHFAGTDFYYHAQADLGARLGKKVPLSGRTKAFFCQSGAEANEAGLKIAKHATGRSRFIAFQGAFHGRTHGALSLTASKAVQRAGFFPTMPGVAHAPFPAPYRNMWGIDGYAEPQELANRAIDAIEAMFDTYVPPQDVAGLWWEPVQGEGGYHVPPPMFPKMLRKLCDEHGILLVADEVQSGMGRTGKWFASEHFGVKPDVISLAKAMGSGFPIGASVARADLDFDENGQHSSTYGGNPMGCAAALATFDVFEEEDLVGNSERMGKVLGRHLETLRQNHRAIGDARGLGLMRAVEFVKKDRSQDQRMRDRVHEIAWKKGLVLLPCGKSGIRFIPPLIVTERQIDGAMAVFEEALKEAKA